MVVLLVTTSTNAVRTALSHIEGVELLTITCDPPLKEAKRKMAEVMDSTNVDCLVTYRCPMVLPEHIYSRTSIGAFNIHPSLLPQYSGLNPWMDMLANGETRGGVTIHKLNTFADCGEIVMQRSFDFPIPIDINTARDKADQIAAHMIVALLNNRDEYLIEGSVDTFGVQMDNASEGGASL